MASLVSGLLASSCSFSFWNKDVNRGLTIIGLPDTISELRIDGERIDTSFAVKNGGYFVSSYDNTLELCDNGKQTFPLYDYQTTDMFRDDGTYKLTIYFSVQESSLSVNSYKVWLSVVFIDGNARIIWDEGESVDYGNSVREYNQEKAGAKIVASYDLSTIIPWATSYVTLASYKDIYYLFVNETIHLIDKDSMEKIGEINVTIPETVSFAP